MLALLLALAASLSGAVPAQQGKAESTVLRYQIDPAQARRCRLAAEDSTDEQACLAVHRYLDWRLEVAGLPTELATEDGVLSVVSTDKASRPLLETFLRGLGGCEFLVVAEDKDGFDLAAEKKALEAWQESHAGRPELEYAVDPARASRRLAWLPTRFGEQSGPPMPVLLPDSLEGTFGSGDFASVAAAKDALGYPALAFLLAEDRTGAFEEFTQEIVGRRLAIALEGEVRSAPSIQAQLSGGGIIEGRFSDEEVKGLADILEGGSPVLRPIKAK